LTIAIVVGLSASATLHRASAQTLEEALIQAYKTNPTLNARRASLRALDEGVPQAQANWRPTVRLSGNVGRRSVETEVNNRVTVDESRTPAQAQVQLTQPLYRGGRTEAGIRRAENTVLAERARLMTTEQTVFLAAITAYVNVLRDDAVVELRANNEQRLRRQLEATQDRFRVGEVTRTDVAQAEGRLARSMADRTAAEGDLQISRAAFERTVGLPPERLSEPPAITDLPRSLRDAQTRAANDNPAVITAQFEELSATERIKEVQGELLPEVNAVGTLQRDYNATARTQRTDTSTVAATMTVPLYEAGSITSRVRQSRETANQRRIEIEESRRTAINDATSALQAYESAQASIESLQLEIRASEIALEGVQQEATVGSRTVLDVLDAEQDLLDAQVRYVRARRDAIVASFTLLAATGRLTARAFNLPVEYYDVDSHYREVQGKWWDMPGALR
jgi:TolC family type I secretion outer membrane protein